jgi:hydrogenase expression/formation protein HypD
MIDKIAKARKKIEDSCHKINSNINIMEVCGTHTVSIFRSGIRSVLPENLKLLSGPGCPVCVTDQGYIDTLLTLADRDDIIIATYGDMIRVPASRGSLETHPNKSAVKVVLSTTDALEAAKNNPEKTVVFAAVGFETTTPATAVAVKQAEKEGITNFCILSNHKIVIPAMKALLSGKNDNINGFLCPGHVSVITGYNIFSEIVEKYNRPCVAAGFEPLGILEGISEICTQIADKTAKLKSVYSAVLTPQGNKIAQKIVRECFEVKDGYWRGLGEIKNSTLQLKDEFSDFDAYKKFDIEIKPVEDNNSCRCGEVLCGLTEPDKCSLFGSKCTPRHPIGPCMVSSEGVCSAWYKYNRRGGNA